MTNKTLSRLFLIGTLGFATVPASAGIVFYATPGDWQTALGAVTPTYLDLSAGTQAPSDIVAGPITFLANGSWLYETTGSSAFTSLSPSAQYVIYKNSPFNLSSSSTSGVYALSFYVGGIFQGSSSNLVLQQISATSTSSSNSTPQTNYNIAVPQFYGIISDAPITAITIDAGSYSNLTLGNVSFAEQTPTPEAATMVLIGTGLALIARYRKYAPNFNATV